MWSLSCAPTHAFVAGNWQLLFVGAKHEDEDEKPLGNDVSSLANNNGNGFFLAAMQIAGCSLGLMWTAAIVPNHAFVTFLIDLVM